MVGVLEKKVNFEPLDPFIGFVTLGMRFKKIKLPQKNLQRAKRFNYFLPYLINLL
jgi:hypothetical protein